MTGKQVKRIKSMSRNRLSYFLTLVTLRCKIIQSLVKISKAQSRQARAEYKITDSDASRDGNPKVWKNGMKCQVEAGDADFLPNPYLTFCPKYNHNNPEPCCDKDCQYYPDNQAFFRATRDTKRAYHNYKRLNFMLLNKKNINKKK